MSAPPPFDLRFDIYAAQCRARCARMLILLIAFAAFDAILPVLLDSIYAPTMPLRTFGLSFRSRRYYRLSRDGTPDYFSCLPSLPRLPDARVYAHLPICLLPDYRPRIRCLHV